MEHNRHHHHHERRDEDDYRRDDRPPPPQYRPPYTENEFPPPNRPYYPGPDQYAPPQPPPPFFQQQPGYAPQPPPPQSFYQQDSGYAPPQPPPHVNYGGYVPPNTSFSHHEQTIPQSETTHHSFSPFHRHESHHETGTGSDLHNRPTYRVYCKANPDFHLTIRDGTVVLARSDPSDQFQNWFKDEKFSTKVKDEEGSPCFSLINKATGQSMKHSVGAGHPVHLTGYNPDVLDESVLWTLSKDFGDGYRTIRMVNNVHLNVDAFHGDKKSGGVHDGTTIVLWKWNKGDNQLWKIVQNPR